MRGPGNIDARTAQGRHAVASGPGGPAGREANVARRRPGRLLLIGGGERRDPDHRVLEHFVAEAGGKGAKVLVLGVSSDEPRETLAEYEEVFRGFGAAQVWTDPVEHRSDAEAEELLAHVEDSTAVFFAGGDQLRFTSVLAGTRAGEAVRERFSAGGYLVAGTSAGAAALGSVMIVGGADDGTVRRSDVRLGVGLGFMRDAVIDTHFNERGRESRLLTIFAQNSQVLGIGIDADTALDVRLGERYTVVGHGVVIVFDGRVTYSNAANVGEDAPLALSGVTLHVLPEGYAFDPRRSKVITPDGEAVTNPQEERSSRAGQGEGEAKRSTKARAASR